MMITWSQNLESSLCCVARAPDVRLRRLLVFSPYFPPHVGGLEGYVSDLGEALLAHEEIGAVTVFTPRLPRDAPAIERRGTGELVVRYPAVELVPNFPLPKVWVIGFWRALRAATPKQNDVFVSHTRFFLTSAFALVCARVRSRPLLHVEHGSDYPQSRQWLTRTAGRLYDLLLGRVLLRRAARVVAVSHAAAQFVQTLAGRDAEVIYRGMHVDRLDAAAADLAVSSWAEGRPIIAYAGRLIDGKGVHDLLTAFHRLADEQAVLCIVGDGPARVGLERLSGSLGITSRVLFVGDVPEARAWGIMRASAVVVNPSYTEGLPTSVLEAAILGRPIVASNVGGTPEILSDGRSGLLFEAGDIDGLVSSLRALLGDSELRAKLGRAARDDARERFDWGESARRFGELVRALSAGDSHARAATALPRVSRRADP